jgi:hypothetical protein
MRIIDYSYIAGTHLRDNIVTIPELNRTKPAVGQFVKLGDLNVKLTCPTALICIDGTVTHQSEAGLINALAPYTVAIKRTSVYAAHEWASSFQNTEWLVSMEIVNGTCAAAIQAVYRARQIIMSAEHDAEEVIIIGHERICTDTVRLFRELGIDVVCGDGLVYMRLGIGFDIGRPVWKWAYNKNPFNFTRETLDTLIPYYRVGYVKLHGTGTASNTEAERGLEELATPLWYKSMIGHTQGISALLETCLILDDPNIRGRILVTANGLGGYYGAFTLTKENARST